METKIPQKVTALRVNKCGSLPVLEAIPLPSINQIHDTDILVKVQAAGITHLDLLLLSGKAPFTVNYPYIPGTDCVGRVVYAGKAAQPLLGKRVILIGAQGTWSQYIPFNMNGVIPISDDVPIQSATYGFSNPLTAIGLLCYIKNQKRKGIVLDAAASALGKMINRLSKRQKIPIVNIVRRKQHQQILKKQGFENILVTQGDWKSKYDSLVKATGVDTLIDSLGSGQVLDKLIRGLPTGGRILIIGNLNQGKPIIDFSKNPNRVEIDKYTIEPWILTKWFMSLSGEDKKKIGVAHSDRLKTDLRTVVTNKFSFKDISKALEATKLNTYQGKILLVP